MARPLSALVLVLGLAACSGSGEPSGADTSAITEASGPPETDTTVPTSASDEASVPPGTDTPTTTEPPAEVVPLGVRWEAGQALHSTGRVDTRSHQFVQAAGATWFLSTRNNGVTIHRSTDGVTWTAADVGSPTPGETLRLDGMVEGPNGRLAAIATRGTNCDTAIDAGDGYQYVGFCTRQAAAVLLSDDGGATWRRVDPPAMAAPGDSSVRPVSIIATATGFVAAGTVAGPDWHARLWSSPDGENWTLDREVRGASPFASAVQLITDGSTMVLVLSDHPCSEPRVSTPGWVLGADWVEWPRVFTGTTTADLAPVAAGTHPFARELDISTCDFLGTLEGVSAIDDAYPGMTGMVIDGAITFLEDPRPTPADLAADEAADEADDEAELTSGLRRMTQLVDGEWTLIEIDGVQSAVDGSRRRSSQLIDVGGMPGIFETGDSGYAVTTPAAILPDGAGGWVQREPDHAILADNIVAAGWVDGVLVAAAMISADPWADSSTADEPAALTLWSSRETSGARPPCELAPGVVCLFADLTQLPGYPDFAGIDLTGADLAFADFGDADVSGANFSGARLWGARSGPEFTADGATFTGAQAQQLNFRSTVGADFTSANVSWSTLWNASDATFTGATIRWASVTVNSLDQLAGVPLAQARITLLPPASGPYEVSLAGLDLTDARIAAPFDGPVLNVLSLDGAIVDNTSLDRVDLTAIDPTTVDLSRVEVWDEASLCPDGLPPDDLPIGTCLRAA
jgi:uncharacterized protein YjbI with pentapeptide repeats